MQQQYAGFPVFGGYAIFHSAYNAKGLVAAQSNVAMNGILYTELDSELGKPESTFIKNGAGALNHFKAQFAGKKLSEEQVTPMVYIDEHHQAHWAYQVSVLSLIQIKFHHDQQRLLMRKVISPLCSGMIYKLKKPM